MLQSDRFLKQLLLHRYAELIQRVANTYSLSDEKIRQLQESILRIDWFYCDPFVAISER
jgi:hypothetical protein